MRRPSDVRPFAAALWGTLLAALTAFALSSGCTPARPPAVELPAASPALEASDVPAREGAKAPERLAETPNVSGLALRRAEIELDRGKGVEGTVAYPQIDGASTPAQRRFNARVERFARAEVAAFERFCVREARHRRAQGLRTIGFGLSADYEVGLATPDLISVKLVWASFTGYLNEDHYTTPFTIDLRDGRELELGDLFAKGSRYLDVFSKICIADLMAEKPDVYTMRDGAPTYDLVKGAALKAENYETWMLTPDGLLITFREYQVGPGMVGLPDVTVPYAALADVANPHGVIPRIANAKA